MRSNLLYILIVALILTSCSKWEGPLPECVNVSDTRDKSLSRLSSDHPAEIPAPRSNRFVSLSVTSESESNRTGAGTRIMIDPDENGAEVVWEPGDKIKVQFLKEGKLYYAELVTEEGGRTSATFTTDADILGGSSYIFFAPGYKKYRETNHMTGERIFGLEVPAKQTAVPGGVAAGSELAFASVDTFTDGMSIVFQNLPALLRFRLEGEVISKVKRIRLKAQKQIAGDSIIYNVEGSPEFHPYKISGDVISFSVTLSGNFVAGEEYHIALWPTDLHGFEMEFSNGNAAFTTVRSTKSFSFSRGEIIDIGTINLGDSFTGAPPVSTDPVKYLSASEGTKPVSIVVVPDGFTLDELPAFDRLARMALESIFDTEPYKTYKERFNAWILKVPSNESGAGVTDGNGNDVTLVDNYFKTRWGASSYNDMIADQDVLYDFVSSNCPDIVSGIHTVDEVPIIILVNDSRYAGVTWFVNDYGKSYCMVSWCSNGEPIIWSYPKVMPASESNPNGGTRKITNADYDVIRWSPGDWRNLVIHEFGHAFGRLMDEYWYSPPNTTASASTINEWHSKAVSLGLNISASYGQTPWDEFLDKKAELMERDSRYSRIGVYQGGWTHIFGAWRSEIVSGMIDNRRYFNAWSRYLLAKRVMTLSGDLDSFNYNYWLERDVTVDPLRDEPWTRSGDPDRSDRYYYIYPHDPEEYEYFPPDVPPRFVKDDYNHVRR